MKFLYTCLIVLLAAMPSCMTVVDTPLERTTFDFGPEATYYVHKYRTKMVYLDSATGIMDFDVIMVVELTNPTADPISYDVSCVFKNGHATERTKVIKDYRVPALKNSLLRIVYSTRSHSMNGYYGMCKVKIYRLR